MAEKTAVTWYEALNQQVEWTEKSMMLGWLADVFGRKVGPGDESLERFSDSLRAMRLQLGHAHFDKSFDLSWLNKELTECRPQLELDIGRKSRLPSMRVDSGDLVSASGYPRASQSSRVSEHTSASDYLRAGEGEGAFAGSPDADSLLDLLRKTLLLQFAQFIGGIIDSGIDETPRIDRCRGVYRDDSDVPDFAAFPPKVEKQWRDEIELLVQHEAAASDVLRCEYFFPRTPKGRFCSDSCRFSTFQITKQLAEPNYLADKQKRYRSSKKS
jgi:hypothetical protein